MPMDALAAFTRLWCLHHVRELLQPGVSLLQLGCVSLVEQAQLVESTRSKPSFSFQEIGNKMLREPVSD